jgi:hypothetical protein
MTWGDERFKHADHSFPQNDVIAEVVACVIELRKPATPTLHSARNGRLPMRSKPKWSKSPVKPGIGVVRINLSGRFSCAIVVSANNGNISAVTLH